MARNALTIKWSSDALADVARFVRFLEKAAPELAPKIANEIIDKTRIIWASPWIGRPIAGTAYSEFVIRALNAPYVVQYLVDDDRVIVLRVFHGRERRV